MPRSNPVPIDAVRRRHAPERAKKKRSALRPELVGVLPVPRIVVQRVEVRHDLRALGDVVALQRRRLVRRVRDAERREVLVPELLADHGQEVRQLRDVVERRQPVGAECDCFYIYISRSMPTANADDPCRPEGT